RVQTGCRAAPGTRRGGGGALPFPRGVGVVYHERGAVVSPVLDRREEAPMDKPNAVELRDWFAGKALQGLLAGPNVPRKSGAESPEQYATRVAEEAYLFA